MRRTLSYDERRARLRARGVPGLLLALVLALGQGGCGSAETAAPRLRVRADVHRSVRHPRDVRGAVRAALLAADTLGRSWRLARPASPIACPAIDPWKGALVRASSPLLRQDSVAVQQIVAAMPSARMAQDTSARLASRPAQICFHRALRREAEARSEASHFGPVTVIRDEAAGRRSEMLSHEEYGTVSAFIDEERVRVGRFVSDVVVLSGPQPIEDGAYQRIVSLLTSRLRAATAEVRR